MAHPTEQHTLPAWPLGCVLALLGLVLACNLVGLAAILVARAGLPYWIEIAGPTGAALLIPGAMLVTALKVRKRNPYAARAWFWGFLLTIALGLALTLIFNLLDFFAFAA